MLFIIIFILVILLIVLFLISFKKKKNSEHFNMELVENLKREFNNTTKNLDDVGGFLVNNFGMPWFKTMLENGDVNFKDTSVCASINRKTCTAYSYMRRDLIPMFFMFPGINLNVPCGIVLDTKKIWSLITLMAVIDGDTNNRSCCTNESYGSILSRNPFAGSDWDWCIYNTLVAKYGKEHPWVTGKYAVFIPLKDKGAGCSTNCNGNLKCMYNNTGGNINQWFMNSSPECKAGNYKDCFEFRLAKPEEVPNDIKKMFSDPNKQPDGFLIHSVSENCETCKKPFLCVFEEHSINDKYKLVYETDRIATYIGKDGLGFEEVVSPEINIGKIAISQCRFEKKDWNGWINVIRNWYKQLLSVMKKDNSTTSNYNYMLANPYSPSYLENEVNLYINPNTDTEEYNSQNKIFQDAIVGFYYTEVTCEEQLQVLNGVETKIGDSSFYNSTDRCDMFWKLDDPSMTTEKRRQWEINNLTQSRDIVRSVAKMFNKKHNKDIPVYKCIANSNSFPNYDSMERALKGEIKFDEIFIIDSEYS